MLGTNWDQIQKLSMLFTLKNDEPLRPVYADVCVYVETSYVHCNMIHKNENIS